MSHYDIITYKASELPKAYEGLIFARWLRSFKMGNLFLRRLKKDKLRAYYKDYHQHIEKLLAKPDSTIRLAVLSDDHDVVLGFAVCREDVLDYVYVDKDQRRQGIAKMLIPKSTTATTHSTELSKGIWKNSQNYKHIKLNPFA